MDPELPPLKCEQCGNAIYPGETLTAITATDLETDETTFTTMVVHEACWPNWSAAHNAEPTT